MQAAERDGRRSAARAGGHADVGSRRARHSSAASAGTPAASAPTIATTSSSSRPSRRASATSRTSARRGARGWSSARTAGSDARHPRRRLHVPVAPPTRATRRSTARATARTTRRRTENRGLEGIDRDRAGRPDSAHSAAHVQGRTPTCQSDPALSIDVDVVAVSSSFARGNENNRHEPDGDLLPRTGPSPGYAVVNLGAATGSDRGCSVVGQVNNLFDRRYYTAGAARARSASPRAGSSSRGRFRRGRRVPRPACDVLCAGRAAPDLDRDAVQIRGRAAAIAGSSPEGK